MPDLARRYPVFILCISGGWLAFGPAGPVQGRFVSYPVVVAAGAALGYRQVPTPAVSDPPVQPLSPDVRAPSDGSLASSTVLVGAPVYMSPTGNIQSSF